MKLNSTLSVLLAAGLALSGTTAQAAGVAFQARLSDLSFGVIDLTPGDGIDAGFTYSLASSSYIVELTGPNGFRELTYDQTSGLADVNYSYALSSSNIALQASASEIRLDGTLQSSNGRIRADAERNYSFTLTAHSVLTFSGSLYQRLEAFPEERENRPASTSVSVEFSSPDIKEEGSWYQGLSVPGYAGVNAQDFWLAYANPTDETITVNMQLQAYGGAHVNAVPEPSTYAMLASGLLPILAAARRRATRAAPGGNQ